MKEPSPLVPQGSFEAQARSKSRVKLAFYTIVAIHLLAIGGFLIIGCKREDKDAAVTEPIATNDLGTVPPFGSDPAVVSPALTNTNAPIAAVPPSLPTNTAPAIPSVPAVSPGPAPGSASVADPLAPAMTEHAIASGDSFSTLATKYGVTVKAIQAANPNLNPTRLQIGTKVKIPPKTVAAVTNGGATAAPAGTYTVKSGDTLGKIADTHKTTVKELQRLNNLTTTQIRVGQRLKLPDSAATGAPGPAGTPPPAQ